MKRIILSALFFASTIANAGVISDKFYGNYAYQDGDRAEQNVSISSPGVITVPGLGTGEFQMSAANNSHLVVRFQNPQNKSPNNYIYCFIDMIHLTTGNLVITDVGGSSACKLNGNLVKGGNTVKRMVMQEQRRGNPNFVTPKNIPTDCVDSDDLDEAGSCAFAGH